MDERIDMFSSYKSCDLLLNDTLQPTCTLVLKSFGFTHLSLFIFIDLSVVIEQKVTLMQSKDPPYLIFWFDRYVLPRETHSLTHDPPACN